MHSNQPKIKIDDRGFTIIEVLIALAIFAIGFMAVSSLQQASTMRTRSAHHYTVANSLAQAHIEDLKSRAWAHAWVTDTGYDASTDTLGASLQVNRQGHVIRWDVDVDPAGGTLNTAVIRVDVFFQNRLQTTLRFVKARDV